MDNGDVPGKPYVHFSSTRKAVDASITTVRSLSGSTHDAASREASSGRPAVRDKKRRELQQRGSERGSVDPTVVSAFASGRHTPPLTENDGVGFVDESLARRLVPAQFIGRRDDFQILTFIQTIEHLNTRGTGFSVDEDLGFGPQRRRLLLRRDGSQGRRARRKTVNGRRHHGQSEQSGGRDLHDDDDDGIVIATSEWYVERGCRMTSFSANAESREEVSER